MRVYWENIFVIDLYVLPFSRKIIFESFYTLIIEYINPEELGISWIDLVIFHT